VAGLATVLFAIDDAHASAIGWIANRNVLIAAAFGVAALLAHHRWRERQWRPGVLVGPLLLAIALLAKESAVGILAYILSYAIFIDRGEMKERILAVTPYVLVVLIWRLGWHVAGYGVAGIDLYIDPLQDPLRFAGMALIRIPILLLAQWTGVPADLNLFLAPQEVIRMALGAVPVLAILALVLTPALRRDRIARFWGLGMIFAVIPCVATAPSDRLLFFVGLGAMGLLARFFAFVREGRIAELRLWWRRWGMYAVTVFLVVIHVLTPLVLLPVRAGQPFGPTEQVNRLYFTPPDGADLTDKTVVLVNSPSVLHATISWSRAVTEKYSAYQRLRVLFSGQSRVTVFRPDDYTLIVRPEEGFFVGLFDFLYRSASHPMQVGETIELQGVTVEIQEVDPQGRPLVVGFEFSVPLEDPSLYWRQFRQNEYRPFTPPAVGDSLTIPRVG
jgi:hypothetical protein